MEDCNEQISFGANESYNISGVVNRHEQGSVNDDRRATNQNEGTDRKMEKNNTIREDWEGKVSSQFFWITQLPTPTDQDKRPSHVKPEQNQIINSNVQEMEQLLASSSQYTTGNILVEIPNRQEQTYPSNYSTARSYTNNGCFATQLGACLKLMNPLEKIWFQGNWSSRWNLNSSNQREAAAILCALRRSEPYFKEMQTKSLKIEADNGSTTFNINRGAAATALAKLVDRTLETADNYNLQLHAYHIPGTQNKIPDSLSRLATSGDYIINEQIHNEALHILRVKPSIDLFSNRRNRRFKRFVSLIPDSWAVAQDSLSIPWKGEVP
ncbi:MAG: hypothetical protein EZS28_002999, partial [Streblomastix strix]